MELTTEVKAKTFRLFRLTEVIREEINAEVPPQQMLLFYYDALNEGVGQVEIANALRMPEGTVSRNVAKLSERMRRTPDGGVERVGYGLIMTRQDDIDDSRKKCCYLTVRGKVLLKKLVNIINT